MSRTAQQQITEIISTHRSLLDKFETAATDVVLKAVDAIVASIESGGVVYICGNGGSAADAQHIAGEFVGRFQAERRALPAVALSTDTSILTAIGNDYSYDDVFVRQVEALVKAGDVLWAFSTSGTSANIIKAVELAGRRNAVIVAFTGRTDSTLEKMADICLCAADKSTARSQEIHQLAYHIICDLVEQSFLSK